MYIYISSHHPLRIFPEINHPAIGGTPMAMEPRDDARLPDSATSLKRWMQAWTKTPTRLRTKISLRLLNTHTHIYIYR